MTDQPMTYAGSGVDYDALDAFKRKAQEAARETAGNIARLGFSEVEASRGESAYLIEGPDFYLAHVEEGLGTKNLVADRLYQAAQEKSPSTARDFFTDKAARYYSYMATDTVAMIVNDMITLGAMPLSVAMHLAVGDSAYFEQDAKIDGLIRGWQRACDWARCTWGCGETPTLKGIVDPGTMLLSGSAVGIIKPKERLIRCNIQHGDAIVALASSGVHANGLTLAREILRQHGDSRLSDGRDFTEALLAPTIIYVRVVEDVLEAGINIHYAVNITGHGWRKLMRAAEPFVYIVEEVPQPQPVFDYIAEHGPVE